LPITADHQHLPVPEGVATVHAGMVPTISR
jgi:hypothetical protein